MWTFIFKTTFNSFENYARTGIFVSKLRLLNYKRFKHRNIYFMINVIFWLHKLQNSISGISVPLINGFLLVMNVPSQSFCYVDLSYLNAASPLISVKLLLVTSIMMCIMVEVMIVRKRVTCNLYVIYWTLILLNLNYQGQ